MPMLKYAQLQRGVLVKRYKRFLADIRLSGEAITVHCPNTGPMMGLLREGAAVCLSLHEGGKRKYAHTLEMIQPEPGGAWVGVHSALANKMVAALLADRRIPALGAYETVRAEVAITPAMLAAGASAQVTRNAQETAADEAAAVAPVRRKRGRDADGVAKPRTGKVPPQSRIDFVLQHADGSQTFVEVKSVTLAEPYEDGTQIALFPDTVSERGQRHVRDLIALTGAGHKAACLYVIQRSDCCAFAPCHARDAEYGRLVRAASEAGVLLVPLLCALDPTLGTAELVGPVPCVIEFGAHM